MIKAGIAALALAGFTGGAPAVAEITRSNEVGFTSRHEAVVEATPKEVWLALISPAGWWQSAHTWSGDAKNLKLTPQAGGCFCETIPEVDEAARFTLEGSVEHMRVVQAYPEQALRMVGALGPLQSEPVTGVLTIAISKVDQGTRIVWEYNVGGAMRYDVPAISKSVDGVIGAQLNALAKLLGAVAAPARQVPTPPLPPTSGSSSARPAAMPPAATLEPKPGARTTAGAAAPATPSRGTTVVKSASSTVPVVTTPAAAAASKTPLPAGIRPPSPPASKETSVADSFGDLTDKPKP
jgi:hypothetical protein